MKHEDPTLQVKFNQRVFMKFYPGLRRRFGQAAHGQRLTLDAAEHDLRPRMALLRAERAQEVELHRCFQIAAAADGGLKLPGRMHIGFRLSQLPRVAPQGKPLALPW